MLNMGAVNVAGTSNIGGKDVVYFNASFGGVNSNYSSTKNIFDMEAYQENQSQCDADFDDFNQNAMNIMLHAREA